MEAVQKCAAKRFDIVLMDIQMPEVDGLEATRRIRAAESLAQVDPIHIIALTAHAMPSDREQARAAGMNGFLVKPIPMDTLRQAIQHALNQSPLEVGDRESAALEDTTESRDCDSVIEPQPLPNWDTVESLMVIMQI